MILRDFLPAETNRTWVQCYRIAALDFSGLTKIPSKTYPPKPENCLHFLLEGGFHILQANGQNSSYSQAVLVGQQTHTFERSTTKRILNFQIVFQSSGIYRLFGIPAHTLTNLHLDAEAALGPDVRLLTQQLLEAKNYQHMIQIADAFVIKLAKKASDHCKVIDKVVDFMKYETTYKLGKVAQQASLSTKQFKRNFFRATGINPTLYSRISRFNKVFNVKNRFPEVDWLTIALTCGYFDYQHLVRDYKEFTGLSPVLFHKLECDSPECVLGLSNDLYKSRSGDYASLNLLQH